MKYFSILFFLCFLFSCTGKDVVAYRKFYNKNHNSENFVELLSRYEKDNPTSFEANVDLARYNFSVGNIEASKKFAERADSLKKFSAGDSRATESKAMLCAMQAYFADLDNNKVEAKKKIEEALVLDDKDEFKLVLANIAFSEGHSEKSFKLYNECFESNPALFTVSDFFPYLHLISESAYKEDFANVVTAALGNGNYRLGLGSLCGKVCDNGGDFSSSVLYAFLDFEFLRGMTETDDTVAVEEFFGEISEKNEGYEEALALIRGYVAKKDLSERYGENTKNFVEKYIVLKNRCELEKASLEDFSEYITLEPHFLNFQEYYLGLFKFLQIFSSTSSEEKSSCLEKIILLSPHSRQAEFARFELGKILKLEEENCSKILLPEEIVAVLPYYEKGEMPEFCDKISEALSLPDNKYVYATVDLLRKNANSLLSKDLQTKLRFGKIENERAKERLNFIFS